ncbi:MAG TPA: hypothetical protein VK821_09645, partial [Dehalococcoidia bacterium]|nr:hypothetical protein [Dehalococcoidia bacterium]
DAVDTGSVTTLAAVSARYRRCVVLDALTLAPDAETGVAIKVAVAAALGGTEACRGAYSVATHGRGTVDRGAADVAAGATVA